MVHEVLANEFRDCIDATASVETIASGFTFTEGPIWHTHDQYLLFSDMPADIRRRWDAQSGVREVMNPSNKCNGMTYDGDMNLIVCEHATSSVVRERPDGTRETLASHFDGKELNSPNDVVVKSDGSIWFTDPWYGRMPGFGVERPRALGWQGVFRIPPGGGAPRLVVDRNLFDQPNGLTFCPDESRLLINDTTNALIRLFNVRPDGTLDSGRVFATGIKSSRAAGVPDGMKCDERANIWVTGPGGVRVYNIRGRHIGTVRVPEMVANLHWGGPDFKTLYMTSSTSLYAVRTHVGPRNEPFMRAPRSSTSAATPPVINTQTPPPARVAPNQHAPQSQQQPSTDGGSDLVLNPHQCAMLIQDMQNDVIIDGGAFAESGSPIHAKQQNVIANGARLADACRRAGVLVIHIHFLSEPGHVDATQNAPLFDGLVSANALVRGTWGAQPVAGLEPKPGDLIVEKNRMSGWEGSKLETILKANGRNVLINTGAWTNMSVEHTARTGADKGYIIVLPEDACSTMNADWHNASVNYAMQNVAHVTNVDDVIAALGAR